MKIRSEQLDLIRFLGKVLDRSLESRPLLHFYDGKCFVRGEDVRALVDFYEGDFEGSVVAEPVLRILEFGLPHVELKRKGEGAFEIGLAGEGVSGDFGGVVYEVERWELPKDLDAKMFKGVDLDRNFVRVVANIFADSKGESVNFIGLSKEGDIFAADALRFLLKGELRDMVFFPLTICDLVLALPQDTQLSYLHHDGTYFFSDRRGLLFQVAYRYTEDIVNRVKDRVTGWVKEFKPVAVVDAKMLARSMRLVSGVDEIVVCNLVFEPDCVIVKGLSGSLKLRAGVKRKGISFGIRVNIGILEFLNAFEGGVSIEVKDNIVCLVVGDCRFVTAMAG
jgi:hypothetical protein